MWGLGTPGYRSLCLLVPLYMFNRLGLLTHRLVLAVGSGHGEERRRRVAVAGARCSPRGLLVLDREALGGLEPDVDAEDQRLFCRLKGRLTS